jgi:endoglucanase
MNSLIKVISENGFNALRIPFSAQMGLSLSTLQPTSINYNANPDLQGLNSAQVLDTLVQRCAAAGLLIMLDMHTLTPGGPNTPLWYDSGTSEAQVIQSWQNMATRYQNSWNVFAVDLTNEPYGATWGNGNPLTDIVPFYEKMGNALLNINPHLLIFCEGTQNFNNVSSNWGGQLAGVTTHPVLLYNQSKLVYSPHAYGKGVTGVDSGPTDWESWFGFIKANAKSALVPSEWGGAAVDYTWQQTFATWLASQDIGDNFYWCLNPDSGDTQGLLEDDWVTQIPQKLAFCITAQPNPSAITVSSTGVPQFPGSVNPTPTPTPVPVPTPTPTPTPVPTGSTVAILSAVTNSWTNNNENFTQMSVTLTNNSGKIIKDILLNVSGPTGMTLNQSWNLNVVSATQISMPSYITQNGLAVGNSIVLGGIWVSGQPSFTIQTVTYM